MNGIQHVSGEMPDPRRIVADLDRRAAAAADQAASDGLSAARSGAPGSFAGSSLISSVAKTSNGYAITIKPAKRKGYIARFVTGGTGIYGPKKKPIRRRKLDADGNPRPFRFRGGYYDSFKGQKANPFIERNRARATAVAERAITSVGLRGPR